MRAESVVVWFHEASHESELAKLQFRECCEKQGTGNVSELVIRRFCFCTCVELYGIFASVSGVKEV